MPEITSDGKIKKDKVVSPPTKVVVRHLPSNLTKEEFLDVVSPLPSHNLLEFYDVEKSLIGHRFTRAYINFTDVDEIHSFRDQYDGYVFVDQKGNESQAIVEFAPFQKVSRRDQSPKRKDPRMATIQDDPDYLEFFQKLENPDPVQLPGTEKMLEEIEAHERILRANKGVPTTKTPLVEYLEQRRSEALLHKMEARSLYEYGGGGRQGEKIRRREERKEMKRLQRLERRKVKLEKEAVIRRNADFADDNEYYDEEDEDHEQMEEEEGGYTHKNAYSKSGPVPAGSKWAKRKEVPSIMAKRARRTERRRKEREERTQVEEQHKRPSSTRHNPSNYVNTAKEYISVKRSTDNSEDYHHASEKDTAGDDDQWEDRVPKRTAYEGTNRQGTGATERGEPSEKTRHQDKSDLLNQAKGSAPEETKGKRYSVLKRKLEEKKQSSTSTTARNEARKTDAGGRYANEKSINSDSFNSSVSKRLSSSDTVTEHEVVTPKESTATFSDHWTMNSSETSTIRFKEKGTGLSEDSSLRSDGSMISEKSDTNEDDHFDNLSSNIGTTTVSQCDDDADGATMEKHTEDTEDDRQRDKSVERITRTMKPADDGERKENAADGDGGGSDAASSKDDNPSPKPSEAGTKERTGSDPRTERKIRNKDRPAMQLYRPGQTRLVSRLKQDSGSTRQGDGSACSGSVGSGGGRSSSSSTSSPEVPMDDERESRLETDEADRAKTNAVGRGRGGGGDPTVLTGANRIRLCKDTEQPIRKGEKSSDYVPERKPLGKGGDKKYRDNCFEEDDDKFNKNLGTKGNPQPRASTRKFSKQNEYEGKYSKPTSNRSKTSDHESSTVYSKSGSSKFPKSRYAPQPPAKTTPSRSFRGKYERDGHQPTTARPSPKDASVVEDQDSRVESQTVGAASKEAKPQGKRYSRMRAAETGARSTPSAMKGKEVVVISADDHPVDESSR